MRSSFLFCILALGSTTAAGAQDDSLEATVNSAKEIRVRSGEKLIVLEQPHLTGGTIAYLRAGDLPSSDSVQLSEVTEIQIPHGSHAGKGALIGGAIGFGLGLGVAIAANADESSWVELSAGEAVLGSLVVAAGGAGIGALIGAASHGWKTIYRAE